MMQEKITAVAMGHEPYLSQLLIARDVFFKGV